MANILQDQYTSVFSTPRENYVLNAMDEAEGLTDIFFWRRLCNILEKMQIGCFNPIL